MLGALEEASKLGLTLVLPMTAPPLAPTPLHPPSDNGANTWAGVKVTTNGFLRAWGSLGARSWWDRGLFSMEGLRCLSLLSVTRDRAQVIFPLLSLGEH